MPRSVAGFSPPKPTAWVGLGASRREVLEKDTELWIVMADPEGNEFCLQ